MICVNVSVAGIVYVIIAVKRSVSNLAAMLSEKTND